MSVKVVAHPETGSIITPTSKEGFGTVRLDSVEIVFSGNFTSKQKRTAFITGEIDVLEMVFKTDGQSVPGKIIKLESFEPFYAGQSPKIYPSDHANAGQPVLTEGKETYLRFEYTRDMSAEDRFIRSSVEENSEVNAESAVGAQAI